MAKTQKETNSLNVYFISVCCSLKCKKLLTTDQSTLKYSYYEVIIYTKTFSACSVIFVWYKTQPFDELSESYLFRKLTSIARGFIRIRDTRILL